LLVKLLESVELGRLDELLELGEPLEFDDVNAVDVELLGRFWLERQRLS
jgi:hypothetical protein